MRLAAMNVGAKMSWFIGTWNQVISKLYQVIEPLNFSKVSLLASISLQFKFHDVWY